MTAPDSTQRSATTEHDLKVWPPYFDDIVAGRKTFEVRYDDRAYGEGDLLHLREYAIDVGYTGRHTMRTVTYILRGGNFGVESGYVVMGIG